MTLVNWLGIAMSHSADRRTRRVHSQSSSRKHGTTKLRVDQLEDRLALSGFGLEDGAYIVEPWLGSYHDVEIQPGDQKIVAAGSTNPNVDHSDTRIAIARYDSLGTADTTYGIGG